MSKSLGQDLVEEWQRLMIEWDSAYAAYAEASSAGGTGPQDRDPALAAALARLNEIKARIDAIVTEGGERRAPNREDLIIGTIEPNPQTAGQDAAEPPAEEGDQVAPKSSGRQ